MQRKLLVMPSSETDTLPPALVEMLVQWGFVYLTEDGGDVIALDWEQAESLSESPIIGQLVS
jgi:hypothetical protein